MSSDDGRDPRRLYRAAWGLAGVGGLVQGTWQVREALQQRYSLPDTVWQTVVWGGTGAIVVGGALAIFAAARSARREPWLVMALAFVVGIAGGMQARRVHAPASAAGVRLSDAGGPGATRPARTLVIPALVEFPRVDALRALPARRATPTPHFPGPTGPSDTPTQKPQQKPTSPKPKGPEVS